MALVHFRKRLGLADTTMIVESREVSIPPLDLRGTLRIPAHAEALIIFVHHSGSSRLSPRNRAVAKVLNEHAMATLLLDLLTEQEAEEREKEFDIDLLADRLGAAVAEIETEPKLRELPLGFFGASTGAAAAFVAAAKLGTHVGAVVSRGGRPDLARQSLESIVAPVLLIVGGEDRDVIALNEEALTRLRSVKAMEVVAGAGHLFREPGALTAVTQHAAKWFEMHLKEGRTEERRPPAANG